MNVSQIKQLHDQGYSWEEIEEIESEQQCYETSAEYEEEMMERREIRAMEGRSAHGDYWRNEAGEYCFG